MEHQERKQADDVRGEKSADNRVSNPLLQEKLHHHLSIIRKELAEDYSLSLKQALSERVISLNRKKLTQILKEEEHSEKAR